VRKEEEKKKRSNVFFGTSKEQNKKITFDLRGEIVTKTSVGG